jgi:hypothetical protein
MISSLFKYLLLTSLTLLVGCQKDYDTVSELIIGKWEWVKSVSAWTGQVSNPQTVGYSLELEFTSDGIMKEYKNDTLLSSTNYSMEVNSSEPTGNFLIYNSGFRSQVYVGIDSLTLNTVYVDGPVSTYIRLK